MTECYKCATPLPDNSKFCMSCGADVSGAGHSHATVNMEPDPQLLHALQEELGNEFKVERELGRGGMAIVYLGTDTHLGRKVAIKLLPPMLTFGSGPAFVERFKREARTAATLDHSNIIPIYRVSTGGKLFWYVMKYLQGESLDAMIKRDGAMPIDRSIEILAQAADALDYAHSFNVVHRDIKPANIMIDQRGRATVTDFGIAKALDTSSLTGSGSAIGTPHYMSPEQCTGVGVSGASDQYSLGVTAYQMLSGHLPFNADSILELMRMHSMDDPPPLTTLRPQVTPRMAAAVERAMGKNADERFPSCAAFAEALARSADEIDEIVRRPTAAVVAPTVSEAPKTPTRKFPRRPAEPETPLQKSAKGDAPQAAAAPRPSAPQPKPSPAPSRSTRSRTFAMAAAVVAVVATGGYFYYQKNLATPTTSKPADSSTTAPTQAGAVDSTTQPATEEKPVAPALAHLELTGVPTGAEILRDGQSVNGTTFELPPNQSTRFVVQQAGFTPWRQSFTPEPGQQVSAKVVLVPVRSVATNPGPRRGQDPAGGANAPVSSPPPSSGIAYLTVGSRPTSAITINGKPAASNPVSDFETPAGRVVIRFVVTDSTGVWSVDTTITMAPGEHRSLGRVPLKKP